MKAKILISALLMSIGLAVSAQAKFEKIKITENVKQNTATRVIVQDSVTKQLNWVLKANLAPVIPDATTTVKGIVKLAGDLGGTADLPTTPTAIHKSGNESRTGNLTISNLVTPSALLLQNGGSSTGILSVTNVSSLPAFTGTTGGAGTLAALNTSSTGTVLSLNATTGASGKLFQGLNNNVETSNIDRLGNISANTFVKTGGLPGQFLKADGSVDSNTYAVDSSVLHTSGNESKNGQLVVVTTGATNALSSSSVSGTALTANSSTGVSFIANNSLGNTSDIARFSLNSAVLAKVNNLGDITGNKFIKTGGLATEYLKADGSVSTLTNPITGTGTANFIPKFTGSGTVANSMIYDNGSQIGIGAGNPTFGKLELGSTSFGTQTFSFFTSDGTVNSRALIQHITTSSSQRVNFTSAFSSGSGDANWSFETGNVLIGTTIDTGKKLEVNGSIARTGGLPTQILMADGSTVTMLSGSATLDFPSTAGQTSSQLTIIVTGAADGDCVSLGVGNSAAVTNGAYSARVSAANTVTVKFNNYSLFAIDPPSGTFKIKVFK